MQQGNGTASPVLSLGPAALRRSSPGPTPPKVPADCGSFFLKVHFQFPNYELFSTTLTTFSEFGIISLVLPPVTFANLTILVYALTIFVRLPKGMAKFLVQISQGRGTQYYPPATSENLRFFDKIINKFSHCATFPFAYEIPMRAPTIRPVLSSMLESSAREECRGERKRDARTRFCLRGKKAACVNSSHTRCQIVGLYRPATGEVDAVPPKTTAAPRTEQEQLFCSILTAP